MNYRKDIQILRGIAVLLVVCFHLGFPGFASGFLGVDVFFVISGYLMAVMYDPTKKADFFAKRAKRLLPAYFAVVLATLMLAAIMTTPNEYSQVSDQTVFATFFASNIGLWYENSYFDKSAFRPLLHLWSLGVEIQFYLLVPMLYWFFKKLKASYFLVAVASAVLCFVIVGLSPKTSFFWMPLRLWEFLAGYGVAKYLSNMRAHKGRAWTWLGAAAMLAIVSIPFFRVNGEALGFLRGHPGVVSVLISLATATALTFGLPARIEANPLATLLERLGGYSYSIYLAHFPVIVLFLYKPFNGTVIKAENNWQTVAMLALVVVVSTLLYALVERPFRLKVNLLGWCFAAATASLTLIPMGGFLQRAIYPANEMSVYQAWSDRSPYRCGKLMRIVDPKAISCDLTRGVPALHRRVLLVGNSHADAIKTVFAGVAASGGVGVSFVADNSPLMAGGLSPASVVKEAKSGGADTIVLHYASRTLGTDALRRVAEFARKDGIAVVLIKPVPVWPDLVPSLILRNMQGEPLPVLGIEDVQAQNVELQSALETTPSVKAFEVADAFCEPKCTLMDRNGKPLYFDSNHLTLTGSERLRPVFERVLDIRSSRSLP
ncbi:acyltransferase family protein [Variovorax paradoxus]|uniref:acyltransferase family protein n=1 Tax=Variovorax paradoxus TaxID=34073 RepID=UPI0027863585|nr:acyltransferase family protein [Variovorax paradoxus]MDP9929196.1 peptidoglycan/LPS O-acetylase OafA/YrhL [Variovorax paradoxus]